MNTQLVDALTQRFNEEVPIALHFGMELSFDDKGRAVVDLPYNPNLDHALGAVHGGVYATMLDIAGWFTAAAVRDEPCWLVTSELSVHFLKPAVRTSLRAVGQVIKSGKRQDVAEMRLYDGEGRLVGHAVGTFVVLPDVPFGQPRDVLSAQQKVLNW
jgi:uncharacterized protein (TIGR00369 family)